MLEDGVRVGTWYLRGKWKQFRTNTLLFRRVNVLQRRAYQFLLQNLRNWREVVYFIFVQLFSASDNDSCFSYNLPSLVRYQLQEIQLFFIYFAYVISRSGVLFKIEPVR